MKKKFTTMAGAVVVTLALIGGATYAWFSDREYAGADGSGNGSEATIANGYVDIGLEMVDKDLILNEDGQFTKVLTVDNKEYPEETSVDVVVELNMGKIFGEGDEGADLWALKYDETEARDGNAGIGANNFFWFDKVETDKLFVDHATLKANIGSSAPTSFKPWDMTHAGFENFYALYDGQEGEVGLQVKSVKATNVTKVDPAEHFDVPVYQSGNNLYFKLPAVNVVDIEIVFELVVDGDVSTHEKLENRFQYSFFRLVDQDETVPEGFIYATATQDVAAAFAAEYRPLTDAAVVYTNGTASATPTTLAALYPQQP